MSPTRPPRAAFEFLIGGEIEVIGGDRAKFGGETRAAGGAKLVGVQFEGIAKRARLFEDAPRLLDGEGGRSQKTSQKRASPANAGSIRSQMRST